MSERYGNVMNKTAYKNIITGVWILILLIFQTTALKYVAYKGIIPDLLFVFLISIAVLEKSAFRCITLSVICGLLMDLLSVRAFGVNIIYYSYSAAMCFALGEHFFKEKMSFTIPIVLIFSFLFEGIFFIINFRIFQWHTIGQAIMTIILPFSMYNAILVLLIYPLTKVTLYKNSEREFIRIR